MKLSHSDQETIRVQLKRILESENFNRSERASELLRYLVEEALAGRGEGLKEYIVGVEALGRDESFDPRIDPIVRAEASRLRRRLEQYYERAGSDDPVEIVLPKGSYTPRFDLRRSEKVLETTAVEPAARHSSAPVTLIFALAALCLTAAGAAAFWLWPRTAEVSVMPVMRFDVDLNSEGSLGSEVGTHLALSPDGTRLVFVTRDADGVSHLNSRRLDESASVRLPETGGARNPFISPDGNWVGFWSGGKIKKVSVNGGAPVVLCNALDLLGAAWNSDGTIIAALHPSRRLWRIRENGGEPEELLDLSSESANPVWPQLLPGGRSVIFTTLAGLGADRGNIEILDLKTRERRVLVKGGTFAKIISDGFLAYVNQGTLFAMPFDAQSGEASGSAVPVLENISYSRTFGYAQFDISRTGVMVFRSGDENDRFVIEWVDRAGKRSPLLQRPGRYEWLKLSGDGSRLAFAAVDSGTASISVIEAATGAVQRITTTDDAYTSVVWAGSETLIVGGRGGMAVVEVHDPQQKRPLTGGGSVQVPWSLSPDGSTLLYYEMVPETGFDLFSVPVKSQENVIEFGRPETLVNTSAYECYPSMSPDGQWLAFASNESGNWEVYVRSLLNNGSKVKISTAGGSSLPFWAENGNEIFYRTWDNRIIILAYSIQDGQFIPGNAVEWPSPNLGDTGVLPNFDITRDGRRVAALVREYDVGDRKNQVTFLLGFGEEIRRKFASGDNVVNAAGGQGRK